MWLCVEDDWKGSDNSTSAQSLLAPDLALKSYLFLKTFSRKPYLPDTFKIAKNHSEVFWYYIVIGWGRSFLQII